MIQPPYGKPWLLYGLLGGSLALNFLMVLEQDREPAAAPVAADTTPAASAAVAATPGAAPGTDAEPALDTPDAEQPPAADVTATPAPGEWRIVEARVEHSLARTFKSAVGGDHADALSATYARLFMWDIDMRRDLQKGDKVRVAWRLSDDDKVEVLAASFRSRKFGKTLTAYRWTAPGDTYPSFWRADGVESALRLKGSPLRDYEQITSLLKDRPSHEGMDFKAPVGTPIYTPRAGTVTRVNWNWAGNGNCAEVRYSDGSVAKFLHLSELKVTAGANVQPGQVIALTGNTGRSTAPHLHYQVERAGKIVDPVEYHGTERRNLPTDVMPAFLQEAERLSTLLLGS